MQSNTTQSCVWLHFIDSCDTVVIFIVSYWLWLLHFSIILLCFKYIAVYRLHPDDGVWPPKRVGRIKKMRLYAYCVCTCFKWSVRRVYVYAVMCGKRALAWLMISVTFSLDKHIIWRMKNQLDVTCYLFNLLCAQHVSDINISIFRSLRLCWWITTSVVLFCKDGCFSNKCTFTVCSGVFGVMCFVALL